MRRQDNKVGILMHAFPDSPLCDAYRTLRINIEYSSIGREIKTIAVTSANRAEGKTTTVLNLSIAYAQVGRKVLLLDADFRKPGVHAAFGIDNGIGLMNLLSGQCKPEEAIRDSGIPNLSVITSGDRPFNASELLASKVFDNLLAGMKASFDVILIDTPPALSVMDAKIIASKSDGVLLVTEYRKVKREEAARVREELNSVQAHLLGVALNKINPKEVEMYPY